MILRTLCAVFRGISSTILRRKAEEVTEEIKGRNMVGTTSFVVNGLDIKDVCE